MQQKILKTAVEFFFGVEKGSVVTRVAVEAWFAF
jgi:hypothetical protein